MATQIETKFFDKLIDDFGIWRHSDGANVIYNDGYSLDDAALGLIVSLTYGKNDKTEVLFSYIEKSQVGDVTLNLADKDHNFLPEMASAETLGKTIWALGCAFNKSLYKNESIKLINGLTPHLDKNANLYGFAFSLLGAVYVSKELSDYYFNRIKERFLEISEEWAWHESIITGGSGIVPYALLRYGMVFKSDEAVQLGNKILLFLEKCCTYERQRGPIGNEGWFTRGTEAAPNFAQSPIDAAYMVWAWTVAFQISSYSFDKERRDAWMQWFDGNNILRIKMYDPSNMRCFDKMESWGVSYTSSAEANNCFLLSKYVTSENLTV